jgi:hypothetical protein
MVQACSANTATKVVRLLRDWVEMTHTGTILENHSRTRETDMPIMSQIVCDGCQAVKKETNHWYTLVVGHDHEACLRPMGFTPSALLQAGAPAGVQYLCGRLCAIEALDRWMGDVTVSVATDKHGA